jgi:hypothetical protein
MGGGDAIGSREKKRRRSVCRPCAIITGFSLTLTGLRKDHHLLCWGGGACDPLFLFMYVCVFLSLHSPDGARGYFYPPSFWGLRGPPDSFSRKIELNFDYPKMDRGRSVPNGLFPFIKRTTIRDM